MLESISAAGSSKLEVLFYLVVQLHCMSMHFKCNLRFIHEVGTHMIIQGTYGISMGDIYEEIMKGKNMLSFILL